MTPRVFFSFCLADIVMVDEVRKQLFSFAKTEKIVLEGVPNLYAWLGPIRNEDNFDEWSLRQLPEESENNAILFFLSQDYVSSNKFQLLEEALALRLQGQTKTHLVPVLLHPVNLKDTVLNDLQELPENGIPLSNWDNPDEAYFAVADGVRKLLSF